MLENSIDFILVFVLFKCGLVRGSIGWNCLDKFYILHEIDIGSIVSILGKGHYKAAYQFDEGQNIISIATLCEFCGACCFAACISCKKTSWKWYYIYIFSIKRQYIFENYVLDFI